MTDAKSFPAYLAAAMAAAGKSQADLARAAKVNTSVVSRWLRGTQPSIENLRLLAPVLRVPVRDLWVAAGHARPEEVGLTEMPEPPGPPSPEESIMAQDWIPEEAKRAILTILDDYRANWERDRDRPARDDRARRG